MGVLSYIIIGQRRGGVKRGRGDQQGRGGGRNNLALPSGQSEDGILLDCPHFSGHKDGVAGSQQGGGRSGSPGPRRAKPGGKEAEAPRSAGPGGNSLQRDYGALRQQIHSQGSALRAEFPK